MARAKLIVIYPPPEDVEAFEKVYQKEQGTQAVGRAPYGISGRTSLPPNMLVSAILRLS